MVESERDINDEVSKETRYYISSMEDSAEEIGKAVPRSLGSKKQFAFDGQAACVGLSGYIFTCSRWISLLNMLVAVFSNCSVTSDTKKLHLPFLLSRASTS